MMIDKLKLWWNSLFKMLNYCCLEKSLFYTIITRLKLILLEYNLKATNIKYTANNYDT